MTAEKIAKKFGVNVMQVGSTKRARKWVAFRGGNGTGLPVVDIAQAFNLVELVRRLEAKLGKHDDTTA